MSEMHSPKPAVESNRRLPILVAAIIAVLAVIGLVAWLILGPTDHLSTGSAERTFVIDCGFDRFRQIMVRKNATAAIVSHGGMKLLEDHTRSLDVDTSADNRPILNAILGKSKANVSVKKQLTVELSDPQVDADELVLNQDVRIDETGMHVQTISTQPAGNLQSYATTLTAMPGELTTEVILTVEISIRVRVSPLFTNIADQRVQAAADSAVDEQRQALETFIANFANEVLILPDLKR